MSRKEGFSPPFDELICGPSYSELRDLGYLNDYNVFYPRFSDRSGSIIGQGNSFQDYNLAQTEANTDDYLLVGQAVDWYRHDLEQAPEISPQMLVYAMSISHGARLLRAFTQAGFDADFVHSRTELNERDQIIQRFRDNDLDILINVMVLTEGVDVPGCDRVMVLRPTKSIIVWYQTTGRSLRRSDSGMTRILDGGDCTVRLGPAGLFYRMDFGRAIQSCPG